MLKSFYFFVIIIFCFATYNCAAQSKIKKNKTQNNIEVKVTKVARPQDVAPYVISGEGDTINVTDDYNLKQGIWIDNIPAKYGDDAQTQYGMYKDNWKIGLWRTYIGAELMSIENFKNNLLYGECKYFDEGFLTTKGYYSGANYKTKYDTISIINEQTTAIKKYVLENNAVSEKDSVWTYYYPRSKKINAIRKYSNGEMLAEQLFDITDEDSIAIAKYNKLLPHNGGKKSVPFGKKQSNVSKQIPADNRKNREKIR